jgi:hypothetical protein
MAPERSGTTRIRKSKVLRKPGHLTSGSRVELKPGAFQAMVDLKPCAFRAMVELELGAFQAMGQLACNLLYIPPP